MLTPQQVARRCADILWPEDHASQGMGMELVEVGPGTATLRMSVRPDMSNCHGTCHGGYIFALADTAFAYACNSWNQRAVAAGADIDYLAPAHAGDTLTARGRAVEQGDRRGIYDIAVSNQDGQVIAVFRGRSARIKGQLFDTGETS
ncbi:MAG: hydroxyphenylacetyl-CoA thioesterase PaaI [Proteobacteria bacterium]|nr:hydroxyphenylacetyl-CoA thioesterase PaaI [Pseudomonadota bacterium]